MYLILVTAEEEYQIMQKQSPQNHISILIPVLRGAEGLDAILSRLISYAYPYKQIIVAIDCPDNKSLVTMKKFKDDVIFDVSESRRGKVKALQAALSHATGEVYLFLDSDVALPEYDILAKVEHEIRDVEMIEPKKIIVQKSFISKIVYYEYIGIGISDSIISRKMGRALGINGAAFAIKSSAFIRMGGFRNEVSEDLDLALRSFMSGVSFKYCDSIEIYTEAPSNLKGWLKQRKRWAYGTALWLKKNRSLLFHIIRSKPSVVLPSLLIIFPSIVTALIMLGFRRIAPYEALIFLLFSLPSRAFPLIVVPFLPLPAVSIAFISLVALLAGAVPYSLLYFLYAKKLGFSFSLLWFLIYYLFYSPLWLLVMIWGIVKVIQGKEIEIDWRA